MSGRWLLLFILVMLLALSAACEQPGAPASPQALKVSQTVKVGTPTPGPTETPAPEPTATPTPKPTETPTPEPTPTPTPTEAPTATPTPEPTPTQEVKEYASIAEALTANTTEIFRFEESDLTVLVDNQWMKIEGFTPYMHLNTEGGYSPELFKQYIDGLREQIGQHRYPIPLLDEEHQGRVPYDPKTNQVTEWTDIPADAHLVMIITHQPFGQKYLEKAGLPDDKLPWLFIFGNIGPTQLDTGIYYDPATNTVYGVTNIPPTVDKQNLNLWSDYSFIDNALSPLAVMTALGENKGLSVEKAWEEVMWDPGNGHGPGPAALLLDMRKVDGYRGLFLTNDAEGKRILPIDVEGVPDFYKK